MKWTFGISGVAGTNTANTVLAQLRQTAATARLRILSITLGVQTAPTTAPVFYLTRATANGTSTTTAVGFPWNNTETVTSLGTVDTAWSAAPTITTTAKLKVGPLPATIGAGWMFDFRDDPLPIQASTTAGGLCLVNAVATGATVGAFAIDITWLE